MQDVAFHNNNFSGPLPTEWHTMTQLRHFFAPANMLTGLTLCKQLFFSNQVPTSTRKAVVEHV